MRFRVLGDLEIGVGTRRGTVTAPRERILLALLLLRRGQTVPIDELIDAVWPEDPPRTARAQVHTCVSRLRQTLHSHDIPPSAIVTERFGYRMVVADTDLDAAVFTRLITRARAVGQSGDPHAAQESYRAALDLWRSTSALPGLGSPAIEAGALVLDEQRLSALEELADIELRTGGGRGMISELTGWVERFPYRERLRAQLMLALTQDGRQAEALELYRRGRQLLADELGMEPGTELRAACHRVLTGDGTGTSGGAAGAAPERPTATRHRPRYLPRGVIDFAGRAAELATVLDDLEKLSVFGAPAAAVAVDGMPGVGKTTFALALAQKAADRYPDGELFIDLHGDGASPPVTVDDALGTLLRQLGVPADRVPADTVERAARWRSEVEHRALFILLDNAADSAQVEPLLPGRSGSVVVITSRRRLVGLDAVRSVTLEPLTETEAVDLLVRVVRDRALVDPDATAALAHLCGGLPLALRLAGARLAHRPTWQVAGMVQRLGGVGSAAAGLAAAGRSVAGAFDLSYRQLEPAAQRTLTRLALHPAGAVGVPAAAALAELPIAEASRHLEDLVDIHLVQSSATDRYHLHDLVRAYLLTGPAVDDPQPARTNAVRRVLGFYVATTAAATAHLEHPTVREMADLGPASPWALAFDTNAAAMTWLDVEWPQIVAGADLAAAHGLTWYVAAIPRALWAYLFQRGLNDVSVRLLERGLKASAVLGDRRRTAELHRLVASAYARLGAVDAALQHLDTAIAAYRLTGDPLGEAAATGNVGNIHVRTGRFRAAVHALRRGLVLAEMVGPGVLPQLTLNLGHALRMVGDYPGALAALRRYLAAIGTTTHEIGYSLALAEIGRIRLALGHYIVAHALLTTSHRIGAAAGLTFAPAETLADLGSFHRAMGEVDTAVEYQRLALDQMSQFDDAAGQCIVGNELAASLHVAGETEAAADMFRTVLRMAERLDDTYEQARAHAGLAATAADPATMERHRIIAAELFDRAGVGRRGRDVARTRRPG